MPLVSARKRGDSKVKGLDARNGNEFQCLQPLREKRPQAHVRENIRQYQES